MAKFDPEREAHKRWINLLQPTGLVVSPPALMRAQMVLDKNAVPVQQALLAALERTPDGDRVLADFPRFAADVLGWSPDDLAGVPGGPALPDTLAVPLPDHGETLRPTFAAIDGMGDGRALLLISVVARGADLDKPPAQGTGWHASPQARLERLLRDTGVPAGLLCNGETLRLVYAPRGESSGHLGFPVAEMGTVGGRAILAALHMLLSEHRVFAAPDGQRLLDVLVASRKHQSEVSTRLAEQVLGALWELLRGVQAADDAANGKVLFDLPRTDPQHVYGGVLTVIMRLVFLLYAEDQGLMPESAVYARNYAIGGLWARLREDAGRHPDTMDQRYGAWAWLLTTFRLVFDGGAHGVLRLPTRNGQLFNPDEYPFLEGRPHGVHRVLGETFEAPRVSDGVVWRVLEGLLVLDGERLSYRGLDVEQVGSVYESMMGYEVRTLPGRALALRPKHVVVDLDALLREPGSKRAAWLKDQAECALPAASATALKDASTVEEAVAALGRRVAPQTPRPLPPGALFLQPGEERRRSGSHYTPRELTEPIVRTTLQPVLAALGERPTPDRILELKVCDPAMGSGAFLVEACRQLAEALVAAWEAHACTPALPPDEDPLLLARRLVAQRCLYGVDKNPFAVSLAKLSLWLVTLARDHAFTFLDHALKHGDSLVGLTREQIGLFHWSPPTRDLGPLFAGVNASVGTASTWRRRIQERGEGEYAARRRDWWEAEAAVREARTVGDAVVAAYFGAEKDKDREGLRLRNRKRVDDWRAAGATEDGPAWELVAELVAGLRGGDRPVPAFHWEIEFPEVFARENAGFDAFVGNPPFAGKNTTIASNRAAFPDWLKLVHAESHGNADLVAHFYRRAFDLLRRGGVFGLIATNTIGQGDTRGTGLRWICIHGGEIVAATRRVKWPGLAAVVVSVVHVHKGAWDGTRVLDGREVPSITAFLFHGGGHENPATLRANEGTAFIGSFVLGMGFTFDDTSEAATPIAEMQRLIDKDPKNGERIFPYIGGSEINSSPTHAHHRYVINFGEMSEVDARAWPDLMAILEARVKPERVKLGDNADGKRRKAHWWLWGRYTPTLFAVQSSLSRTLARSSISSHHVLAWLPPNVVPSHNVTVFAVDKSVALPVLQSRIHELFANFFSSGLEDRLGYRLSDCFETFPFPPGWTTDPALEAAGEAYYAFRAELMVRNDEGLTATYNRFHDPDERSPDIHRLRELHAAMDRAVLDAYGWSDIPTDCDFFLDYEIDEETWGTKKKPWRLRWPDAVHDEVLARLLALNQARHAEEVAAGLHGKPAKKATAKPKKPRASAKPAQKASTRGPGLPLFATDPSDDAT